MVDFENGKSGGFDLGGPSEEGLETGSNQYQDAGATYSPGTRILQADANGVVVLPAGVSLEDITVRGTDLVVVLADGTEMVIPGGAIIVPQFVVEGVAIAPQTVSDYLNGIDPEAGPQAQTPSSGGNFAADEGAIQDAFDRGDLLPYTELSRPIEQEEEILPFEDSDPEVVIETPDNPIGAENAIATVLEEGLPERGDEPEGTDEPGSGETTSGTIVFDAPDGLSAIILNGVEISGVGQEFVTDLGVLTITSIDLSSGEVGFTYTLTDNTLDPASVDTFDVTVRDTDGDEADAMLTVNIVDDAPIAFNDAATVEAATFGPVEGNVLDNDVSGADDYQVGENGVEAVTGFSNAGGSANPGDSLQGEYGVLTLNADGTYSYTRDFNTPGGVTDTFTYTIIDQDGSTSEAQLVITIEDAPDTIDFVPTTGDGTVVEEAGLPPRDGEPVGSGEGADDNPNNNSDTSETTTATIEFNSPDGLGSITINGVEVDLDNEAGNDADDQVIIDDETGTLVITAVTYDPTTGNGTITYEYTLGDNTSGDDTTVEFEIVVTDLDGDIAEDTVVIEIIDDEPTATDNANSVSEGQSVSGNVVTDDDGDGVDESGADDYAVAGPVVDADLINPPAGVTLDNKAVAGDGTITLTTSIGTLVIEPDGSYTFTSDSETINANTALTFTYTIEDGDGDQSTAELVIDIGNVGGKVSDNNAIVNEAGLDGIGSDAASNSEFFTTGQITVSGAAGPFTFTLTDPANGDYGALTLNSNGSYTYELTSPIDGDSLVPSQGGNNGNNPINDQESFGYEVRDAGGNLIGTGTIVVTIVDDVPSIDIAEGDADPETLVTQDADTIGLASDTATGDASSAFAVINQDYGADGAGSVSISYALTLLATVDGVDNDTGLQSNGASIFVYQLANGTIVGSTAGAAPADATDPSVIFSISIDSGSGMVTLTQNAEIDHDLPGSSSAYDSQLAELASGLVGVTASGTISDGDGDIASDSETIDLGGYVKFADDGPLAFDDANSVEEAIGSATTGNVYDASGASAGDNADEPGADGAAADNEVTGVYFGAEADVGTATIDPVTGATLVAGTYGNLTINPDGSYSYVVTQSGIPADATETFTYEITDGDGDVDYAELVITINQDQNVPDIGGDTVTVYEDGLADGEQYGANSETAPGSFLVTTNGESVTFTLTADNGNTLTDPAIGETLTTTKGVLEITDIIDNLDGTFTYEYEYTLTAALTHSGQGEINPLSDTITMSIEDATGDVDLTPGEIVISIVDDVPLVSGSTNPANAVTVDETNLAAGAATIGLGTFTQGNDTDVTGNPTVATSVSLGNILNVNSNFGADGPAAGGGLTYSLNVVDPNTQLFTTDGTLVQMVALSDTVVVGVISGINTAAFAIEIDPTSGVLTVEQYVSLFHTDDTDGNDPEFLDPGSLTAVIDIEDGDGDTAQSTAIDITSLITFRDDGPSISAVLDTGSTVTVDETNLAAGAATINLGTFDQGADDDVSLNPTVVGAATTDNVLTVTSSFGADGPDGTLTYSLIVDDATSGLATTEGTLINLVKVSDTVVVGNVAGVNTAAFAIEIDPTTGEVTVEQYISLFHATNPDPNDPVQLSLGKVSAVVSLEDGDGDALDSTGVDIAPLITFRDDGPTLGTIQDQQASNDPAQAPAVGTLFFDAGADGAATSMTITATTTGITSGGKPLVTEQVGNVLTAYVDTDEDGVRDAGETTEVFTLTIDPDAGASGQYTFDLITALDPTITDIPIGSGSSFGVGPSSSVIVTDDATNLDLVYVTAWSGGATFDPTDPTTWDDAIQESDVNGSTQGWGRGNNNFDQDEFLRFDFGDLNDYDGAGGYTPPGGQNIVDVSYATFSFFQFNANEEIIFVAHYTDGSSETFILDGATDTGTFTISAPAGTFIDWVDAYQSAGSMKLNLTNIGVADSAISETIDFTLQLNDGDGDPTSTQAFSVEIGDGLVPFAPVAPIVLDLDGGGADFSSLSANIAYDYDGDGIKSKTAWVAAGSAILAYDMNGDNMVTDASEFVFGGNGMTDLQAVAALYDDNGDGVLDANDAAYESFGLWIDADLDAESDPGEFVSLSDAGITSIELVSDGNVFGAADGDVTIFGTASYTMADGSTGEVADAAFDTGGNVDAAMEALLALGDGGIDGAPEQLADAEDGSAKSTQDLPAIKAIIDDALAESAVEALLDNLTGANDDYRAVAEVDFYLGNDALTFSIDGGAFAFDNGTMVDMHEDAAALAAANA